MVTTEAYRLTPAGKYNPATNSWTATSTANAPSARSYHTAVWTGSEMIVWGGYASSAYLNTGGRYDPPTDTWTATSTTNAPEARYNHAAVWTGSEMIVWGGYNGDYLNTGGQIRPCYRCLDSNEHHQRGRRAKPSHRRLDRQSDDCVGRTRQLP